VREMDGEGGGRREERENFAGAVYMHAVLSQWPEWTAARGEEVRR